MKDEFRVLLNTSISSFDEDLATMIVLASFGQNQTFLIQRLALASHLQNIRSIANAVFTPSEQNMVENTNASLAKQFVSLDGFVN